MFDRRHHDNEHMYIFMEFNTAHLVFPTAKQGGGERLEGLADQSTVSSYIFHAGFAFGIIEENVLSILKYDPNVPLSNIFDHTCILLNLNGEAQWLSEVHNIFHSFQRHNFL